MDIKEIRKARLRQLINLKFGGVMARLAEAIGRQSSYVARLLAENSDHSRNIGEKLAREIEQACDLPYRYLDAPLDADFIPDGSGWTAPIANDHASEIQSRMANIEWRDTLQVPKLEVALDPDVIAWGIPSGLDRMISSIGLHSAWIRSHLSVTAPINLRAISATGNSMEPMIRDGDLLLIDTGVQSFAQDGVYVLTISGQIMIKRIQRVLDGLRVLSDNRVYPEMIIPTDREHELQIHGRAVYTWTGTAL